MNPLTVLIIDDDQDDREFLIETVTAIQPDVRCMELKNGLEAVSLLNSDESILPDFIFLDMNMPVMNGPKCLQEIMKLKRLRQVPVIIYTTSRLNPEQQQFVQYDTVHFMRKPASMSGLRNAVHNILEHRWSLIDNMAE
jgi:CheY-like chemotaxis protein